MKPIIAGIVLSVALIAIVAFADDRKFFQVPDDKPEVARLNARIKDLESRLAAASASAADIDLSGLSDLKPSVRPVQWVITSAPGCGYCPAFKRQLKHRLKDWEVSESPDAHFRLVEITNDEWRKIGVTLPLSELHVNGEVVERREGAVSPDELANLYISTANKIVPDPEASYGVGIGTVPIKPQVSALLSALKPFLDGGTLRIEYTPKPGVVREWLTIKQGPAGIKIPAKTVIVFSFEDGQFVGRFDGVSPRVIVGPFERGPTAVEVSTERIAIRLPWCPDPEIKLNDPRGK